MTPSTDQNFSPTMTLLPDLNFYRISRGFHRAFAMSVVCLQYISLFDPDTFVQSHLELAIAYAQLVKPILFPNLVTIFRTLHFERTVSILPYIFIVANCY